MTYVSAWPNKRPHVLPPHTATQSEWFKQANILCKYLAPELQVSAKQATKGTPLYPRDVLIACMRGTLFYTTAKDGTKTFSMATRRAVSDSLDVLSQLTGSLIYRGAEFWEAVGIPNAAGDVLTADVNKLPVWLPPAGGSGGNLVKIAQVDAPTSGAISFSGLDLTPYSKVFAELTGITMVTDGAYVWCQLEISSSLVTSGYAACSQHQSTSGATNSYNSTSVGQVSMTGASALWGTGNATGECLNGEIEILDPGGSLYKNIRFEGANNFPTIAGGKFEGAAVLQNTGPVTGLKIFSSTGGLAAGVVQLYGLEL